MDFNLDILHFAKNNKLSIIVVEKT